jgi:hypothetical protein
LTPASPQTDFPPEENLQFITDPSIRSANDYFGRVFTRKRIVGTDTSAQASYCGEGV